MGRMVRPLWINKKKPFFTHYTAGCSGCWHVYVWLYDDRRSMKIASFPRGTRCAGIDAEAEALKLCCRLNDEWRKEQGNGLGH